MTGAGTSDRRADLVAPSAPLLALFEKWALRLNRDQGAALLEFAISLPLLVVFIVGIFDFSGAFTQKQKVEQAAQEAAIIAGAQPTSDIATTNSDPASLHSAVNAVYNSLVGSGVLSAGNCAPPFSASGGGNLTWTYILSACNSTYPADNLTVTINRGAVFTASSPVVVGSSVTVTYPYHWRFGSVIQLLFPGPNGYSTPTQVTETATVHNQM